MAAVVVLGMATGIDRQTDKGVAPLLAVWLVQGIGAVALVVFAVGVRVCALTWRSTPAPVLRWFTAGTLLWVVWVFVRVGEYAS